MKLKLICLCTVVFALSACYNANRNGSESLSNCSENNGEKSSTCAGCPSATECSGHSTDKGEVVAANAADAVTVYYFHGSRQCKTCKAVGEVAKTTVKKYFTGSDKVKFVEINTEDEAMKELVQRHKMTGSGLGVIRNGEYEDLTVMAFSLALREPGKMEINLKEAINKRLYTDY